MKDVKTIEKVIRVDFTREVKEYLELGYTVANYGLIDNGGCTVWWAIMIYE